MVSAGNIYFEALVWLKMSSDQTQAMSPLILAVEFLGVV